MLPPVRRLRGSRPHKILMSMNIKSVLGGFALSALLLAGVVACPVAMLLRNTVEATERQKRSYEESMKA